MATVKEFKEWLNQFPDDTIVQVGFQETATGYQSYGQVRFNTLELIKNSFGDGWEFLDFRDNQFVKKTEPHYGKTFLRLGESC